ncbi:hypothetical protein [Streptosporangium sp. NPDC048865]|uniref:hypothetical protein n=1 Tax=Streptosporangium sp. NPDC048865 TaxID=3155766 RepID=UPI00342B2ABA
MTNRDLKVSIDGDPRKLIAAAKASAAAVKRLEAELEKTNAQTKKLEAELERMGQRKNFPVGDAVAEAQKSFKGLFDDIGSLGPARVGLLAAAIAALPAAAAPAAAGVTLALGGALAGVGLTAAAQSARVKGEFEDLADDVGDSLQDIAAPLEQSLLKTSDVARRAFASVEPELESAFSKMAPKIDTFVERMGAGVAELEPALDPLADGFGAVLDAIGGRSDEIFGNLEHGITSLAETAERHADDIAGLFEVVSAAAAGTADAVGFLAEDWDRSLAQWEPIVEAITGSHHDLNNSNAEITRTTQAAVDAALAAASPWIDLGVAMDGTKLSADALQAELDELNGAMNLDEAASRYQEALDRTTESIRRNGQSLSINTEKGRSNRDAIRDMARAAQDHIVKMAEEGASVSAVSSRYSTYRGQLSNALQAAGATRGEAKRLTDQWLQVPKSVSTAVRANTGQATSAISGVRGGLASLRDKVVRVTVAYSSTGRATINGVPSVGAFDRAEGGPIYGPGTSTSDSIPAWLSNGEYVINAKATKRHRQLIEAINAGRFAQGGPVGYAAGGQVSANVPISEFVQRFMGTTASKSDFAQAVRARKDAVDQLLRAERKLAEDRRKDRSARTIADSEARVRKERRDLSAVTDKLTLTEARYKKGKITAVQKLNAGLILGIKNTGAFIANITKLADMGFGDLAQQLLAAGGPEAEAMAASAVKLSKSKLKTLNARVVTAGKQQAKLDALPNVLKVKAAQKAGSKSVKDLMHATGLSEEDIAEAFAAMGYAAGGIERYARGGRRPGPGIATRPTVLFGEGRAPEAFIPYDRAHRPRAMGLVNQVAADLGMRRGGSVTNVYNVTVQGAIDPLGTARTVEKALRTLKRTNGRTSLEF